jgi:hypothetical protein
MRNWILIFGVIGILILAFAAKLGKGRKVYEAQGDDDELHLELYAQ